MEIEFEREKLYLEVWATPVSKLAAQYGLSDNGLRKVCIALNIPLPTRGHWAKVAAGHKVTTPILMATMGKTTYRTAKAPLPPAEKTGDPWLEDRLAFEMDPANLIVLRDTLERPHPLVAATARAFEAARKKLLKSRDRPATSTPKNLDDVFKPGVMDLLHNWNDYVKKGHIPDLPDDVLPMRVSLDSGERALRIWDALIKACVARGMKVAASGRRLVVSERGETVELRITEKLKHVVGPTKNLSRVDQLMRMNEHYEPTGVLRLVLGDSLWVANYEDTPACSLDLQLNDVLARIHRRVVIEVANRRKHVEARAHLDQIALQKAIEAREKAERDRMIAEEKIRVEELSAEADRWQQAQAIRAYVTHVREIEDAVSAERPSVISDWVDWASRVADQLDPTQRRRDACYGQVVDGDKGSVDA